MISELTKLYRKISGCVQIDVDEEFAKVPLEQRPFIYHKLIWNIPRGRRNAYLKNDERAFELAKVICEIALKATLDIYADDIIPDGRTTFADRLAKRDLDFAHTIIHNCEHFETITFFLVTEDGQHITLDDEESSDKILIDRL